MPASAEVTSAVIRLFDQADEANRNTPTRQGNVVCLGPSAGRDQATDAGAAQTEDSGKTNGQTAGHDQAADADVMVTADLHGQRLAFQRLVEIADLDRHPRRHLIMQEVSHGGPMYPERQGCMSHLMLEDVARLKVEYPQRFHFLLSNHELAELTDFPISKSRRMLNLLFRCGVREMYGERADEVRQAYCRFLASCPLAVRVAGGIFICHSAPENCDRQPYDATVFQRPVEPADLKPGGAVFQLVWGRDFRPQNAQAFANLVDARVLIHGHEPCIDGYLAPNDVQIIIDCCCGPATYLMLPLDGRPRNHQDVLKSVRFLDDQPE